MGRLLLIFDGFDEMADKLDRQKMINNFWELARVVVPGAKAVLTCRTEHFPNAKEGRDLLNAKLKASTRYLSGDPPQFEILELEQFDEDQIRDALLKRTDQKTVDLIMSHQELLDLAGRPVMLDFLVEALPDIEAEKPSIFMQQRQSWKGISRKSELLLQWRISFIFYVNCPGRC
jgi:predicted NACHT family NTPase